MALIKYSEIKGQPVQAIDKELGAVKDVYFDDHTWTVRYFVVDTAKWLPGKKVLISPESVKNLVPNWPVQVALRSDQVKDCPPIDADKPVSRQYEMVLSGYYGWIPYWEPGNLIDLKHPYGPYLYSRRFEYLPTDVSDILQGRRVDQDPNLRSCKAIHNYHVHAKDGDIGHIDDFIVDTETWEVPYVIVDTKNWLPGRKVTIPHHVISGVSIAERRVNVVTSRDMIETAPEIDQSEGDADLEKQVLYHYFGFENKKPILSLGSQY